MDRWRRRIRSGCRGRPVHSQSPNEVAEQLRADNVEVAVLHVHSMKPLDEATRIQFERRFRLASLIATVCGLRR